MGDHTVEVGSVNTQSQPVNVQMEQTTVKARAEMSLCPPDDKQRLDDDRMIPNIGDRREIFQNGAIHSPDGETSFPVRLQFIRTRNNNGGVDVRCIVPALPMGMDNPLKLDMT